MYIATSSYKNIPTMTRKYLAWFTTLIHSCRIFGQQPQWSQPSNSTETKRVYQLSRGNLFPDLKFISLE
jgi:hypothetical protein